MVKGLICVIDVQPANLPQQRHADVSLYQNLSGMLLTPFCFYARENEDSSKCKMIFKLVSTSSI